LSFLYFFSFFLFLFLFPFSCFREVPEETPRRE